MTTSLQTLACSRSLGPLNFGAGTWAVRTLSACQGQSQASVALMGPEPPMLEEEAHLPKLLLKRQPDLGNGQSPCGLTARYVPRLMGYPGSQVSLTAGRPSRPDRPKAVHAPPALLSYGNSRIVCFIAVSFILLGKYCFLQICFVSVTRLSSLCHFSRSMAHSVFLITFW